ncbi:hypothetical protein J0S82_009049, partial [Galemys pyrenaicus]
TSSPELRCDYETDEVSGLRAEVTKHSWTFPHHRHLSSAVCCAASTSSMDLMEKAWALRGKSTRSNPCPSRRIMKVIRLFKDTTKGSKLAELPRFTGSSPLMSAVGEGAWHKRSLGIRPSKNPSPALCCPVSPAELWCMLSLPLTLSCSFPPDLSTSTLRMSFLKSSTPVFSRTSPPCTVPEKDKWQRDKPRGESDCVCCPAVRVRARVCVCMCAGFVVRVQDAAGLYQGTSASDAFQSPNAWEGGQRPAPGPPALLCLHLKDTPAGCRAWPAHVSLPDIPANTLSPEWAVLLLSAVRASLGLRKVSGFSPSRHWYNDGHLRCCVHAYVGMRNLLADSHGAWSFTVRWSYSVTQKRRGRACQQDESQLAGSYCAWPSMQAALVKTDEDGHEVGTRNDPYWLTIFQLSSVSYASYISGDALEGTGEKYSLLTNRQRAHPCPETVQLFTARGAGSPSSHFQWPPTNQGPQRRREHREVHAAQRPSLRARSVGPRRGAGRGTRGQRAEEPGGPALSPRGRPAAPPRPAPAGPAPHSPVALPRLTRVLATFPLWVMFLLCFSLAIRIRCLATMARALGSALDSHLQGSPVSPGPGRAVPPGLALQVARRGRALRTRSQPPTFWLQREARARTEVIFHLRKPSPTSSPSFRSPQLPNQRAPMQPLPGVLFSHRAHRCGLQMRTESARGEGPCLVGMGQPKAAGEGSSGHEHLCAQGRGRICTRFLGRERTQTPGERLGRQLLRHGRKVSLLTGPELVGEPSKGAPLSGV